MLYDLDTNCKVSNGRPVCTCIKSYFGDPIKGCHPECIVSLKL